MQYDEGVIAQVWQKARATPDQDPHQWRKDECGAWLYREHYGSEESEFGWWIANLSLGEGDAVEDLKPLHRANGFDIGNAALRCTVSADRAGLAPEQSVIQPRNAEM